MNASLFPRIERLLEKSWDERFRVLYRRLAQTGRQAASAIPRVMHLSPGFFWILGNDVIRAAMFNGEFEPAEQKFVDRFLKPGMTVLDIGAYHGLYTLIASIKVGREGRVVAFEPSREQRKRLSWHLWLNRCKNVRVEEMALGSEEGEESFFAVRGAHAGFSSLRRPDTAADVEIIRVAVTTLDSYLSRNALSSVDLIKVDVEGGELDVFRGASSLLCGQIRPVILCELQDIRSQPWGHNAKEVARFIEDRGYRWFSPHLDGTLELAAGSPDDQGRNLIAVPSERMAQFLRERLIPNS